MQRITRDMIERKVVYLNNLTGAAQHAHKFTLDGKGEKVFVRNDIGHLVQNEGHHYLQGAYGKFKIERLSDHGCTRDPMETGFATKREVFDALCAYIDGIELGIKIGKGSRNVK